MPLFEFRCLECERTFEELVPSSAVATKTPDVRCSHCDATRVERLLSGFAVGETPSRFPGPPAGPCGSSCGCFPS